VVQLETTVTQNEILAIFVLLDSVAQVNRVSANERAGDIILPTAVLDSCKSKKFPRDLQLTKNLFTKPFVRSR